MAFVAAKRRKFSYFLRMSIQFLQQNWAIVVASVMGGAILLFVVFRVLQDSARGQLMQLVRLYDEKVTAATKAQQRSSSARTRLQKLQNRQDSAKPRHVQEAAEALEDAESLHKIAADQVLIAANHVRKFILKEFPPRQQDSLRAKYLNDSAPDKKPFTF